MSYIALNFGGVLFKARQKEQGDDEAQGVDETFIDAYVIYYYNTYIQVTIIIYKKVLNMVLRLQVDGAWVSTVWLCF